ncbi:MAG: M23 family metallopeptidase [Bacillaceae bacterium]|nr:M23 family metallopeptidase [Bacillaceae bacterium]
MASDDNQNGSVTPEKPDEYKKTVVENAVIRYFNPYASITENLEQPRQEVMVYKIQKGDTLSEIASRYNVSLQELIAYNRISNPHLLSIGLELKIPPEEKLYYVKAGDTLEKIAKENEISIEELLEKNPILKEASDALYVGQPLKIPEIKQTISQNYYAVNPKRQIVTIASRKKEQSFPIPAMSWPVTGKITSHFGQRWGKLHAGIDIWNEKEGEAVIKAAKPGKVVKVKRDHYGYGYHVVLDHGNGIQTYYAHMRQITVQEGDWVSEGARLGYMGSTGNSTGYHLHFEIRYQGRPINPLPYLK